MLLREVDCLCTVLFCVSVDAAQGCINGGCSFQGVMAYNVFGGTLNLAQSINSVAHSWKSMLIYE